MKKILVGSMFVLLVLIAPLPLFTSGREDPFSETQRAYA
jgi:hypothetical protein